MRTADNGVDDYHDEAGRQSFALLTPRFSSGAERQNTRQTAARLGEQCAAFLLGCAMSAGAHVLIGMASLAIPTLAVAVLFAASTWRDPNAGGS